MHREEIMSHLILKGAQRLNMEGIPMKSLLLTTAIAVLLSMPATAGEKITGSTMDYQIVSETSVAWSGHTIKQVSSTWKGTSPNPNWGQWSVTAVEQQDVVGPDAVTRNWGTQHQANGDLAFFTCEGTSKVTPKEAGAFDGVAQGKCLWTGGTGKFKSLKGPATYSCKFTQASGGCDFQGDVEY
jgi:hypothetical protein